MNVTISPDLKPQYLMRIGFEIDLARKRIEEVKALHSHDIDQHAYKVKLTLAEEGLNFWGLMYHAVKNEFKKLEIPAHEDSLLTGEIISYTVQVDV